ncbi:MAG: peroxidase-related enzyme [Bacteroidia bacterium]|jgi:uncharacterized peroxidase-related enzyme|nr:peroxidase-related enzyme [Bacteroidia bacterium]
MAYIKVIEPVESEGELKRIYNDLLSVRGQIAEVYKVQSLNPESILKHMELYMTLMYGKSPLSRLQREMIAVVVSVSNNCKYCTVHHCEALRKYIKDENILVNLQLDFAKAGLPELESTLCELAWQLTRIPHISNEFLLQKLRGLGLDDRAILDATLIIGYFNFVNRLVLGLGVCIEPEKGKGFNY